MLLPINSLLFEQQHSSSSKDSIIRKPLWQPWVTITTVIWSLRGKYLFQSMFHILCRVTPPCSPNLSCINEDFTHLLSCNPYPTRISHIISPNKGVECPKNLSEAHRTSPEQRISPRPICNWRHSDRFGERVSSCFATTSYDEVFV